MRRILTSKYTFILYLILLVAAMLLPFEHWGVKHPRFIKQNSWSDLAIHFCAFLPWMVIAYGIFRDKLRDWLSFSLGLVMVLGLEWTQQHSPSRFFSQDDLLAGAAGLLCSWLILCMIRWLHR